MARTLQQDFTAELTRLLARGLTQEEEVLARRYYSDKERESMDEGDFCGPHRSFPIKTQEDVTNGSRLIGHADNPASVKACIIGKAKANGWSLPDAWKEDDKKERAMPQHIRAAVSTAPAMGAPIPGISGMGEPPVSPLDERTPAKEPTQNEVRDGVVPNTNLSELTHPPFTGTHQHDHIHADGSRAGESHEHREDNHHEHQDYGVNRAARSAVSPFALYLPITRSDATKRMVYGQATVEQPDAYGTIFGYYPDAWKKWRGNVREQHDPKKAVGKALQVEEDPTERAIYVASKISRGAQDTWLKVEDDVLTGYSASIIPDPEYGNDIAKWPKKEYGGKQYPYLPRYSVVELSLVDNPATPGCNISIVRANGTATDVLDFTEEEPLAPAPAPLERVGRKISGPTSSQLHAARDGSLMAARQIMGTCGCDECQAHARRLDPDGDGDVDLPGSAADTDHDAEKTMRALAPAFVRLHAIAGEFARRDTSLTAAFTTAFEALTQKLDAVIARVADTSSLDEVRSVLTEVKGQVDVIAQQPAAGGPVLNGQGINKALPNSPYYLPPDATNAVLDRMQQMGALDTLDKQVAAAALAIRPMFGGNKGQ